MHLVEVEQVVDSWQTIDYFLVQPQQHYDWFIVFDFQGLISGI